MIEEVNNSDPRIGSILNERYRIIDRLAAGGMAVVYKGERLELGRPVAIKFLQEMMLQNPKFITRFESEARAMSKLSHPYCVSVIDFGVEGAPYIVMDYVEGLTMKALLAKERVSISRAITLTRQILAGIAHAHSQGIVHRDIKPENIMLQEATGVGEQVRIFDFGLAKIVDSGTAASLSHSSLVAGTPNYMSPEQSRGGKIDERTDLYSISVVFFELLTGRKPFIHDDFLEVVRMHREMIPPTLNDVCGEEAFSEELQSVVSKALSKDPDRRFQNAEEFTAALNATPEGIRAKDHEASIVPDPKAKTLPVGTMTPFEHLLQPGPRAKPSVGPTRKIESDDQPEESVEELSEEVAEETKAIEEPSEPEPARQMFEAPPPAASSSRRVLFGILFFLIGLFIYLVWPQDGDEPADEAVPRTKAPDSKPAKKTKKKDARQPKEVKSSTVAKTEKQQAHSQAEEKAEKKAEEKAAQDISEKAEAEETPEVNDQRDDTTTSSLPEVKSIGDVKELIREGKREAAIQGLQKLRREHPRNAQIVFLLANLYSEKNWWSDALEHYREAIRLDSSYRKRSALIRNIIQMLSAEKLGKKAMYTLIKTVGRPALPQLRRALKREKNPTAKRRISATIRKIGGR